MSFTSEELVQRYSGPIRRIVFEVRGSAGGRLDRTELFHHGVEGLLDAARRYDPAHGVRFWTFVYPRVRGAIVDAIRRSMPLSRRVHERLGKEALGPFTPEAIAIVRGETLGVHDTEPCDPDGDGSDRVLRIDALDPAEHVETARCAQAIHEAMSRLTLQERMILRGIFFEERPLRDLAAELGISISYVSRIHTRALGRLKTALGAEWGYEADTARPWVRARSVERDWIEVVLEADASGQLEATETDVLDDTDVANAA